MITRRAWTVLLLLAAQVYAGEPPALALKAPRPAPAPKLRPKALAAAIKRGRHFLLRNQNRNGSWGSARNTKALNVYAPAPGAHRAFRAAVTSLSIIALIETGEKDARPKLRKARRWLIDNLPKVKRSSPDTLYNIWAHAYSIQALLRLEQRQKLDWWEKPTVKKLIRSQIDRLHRYATVNGGWAYYNFGPVTRKPSSLSDSFVTAAILIALREAKDAGYKVPHKLVARARAALRRQRKPDYSYLYSEAFKYWPLAVVNRPAGGLGRAQVCNLALRFWGDSTVTDGVLHAWLKRFIARQGWHDLGRKRPEPHESWFGVAGYYYYFGHYYASRSLMQLPAGQRPLYQRHLAATIIARQEKDGSWWDFPLYNYHKFYGTAYALMALHRCQK